jgi:SOS-response transcriptional repressor LexA
MELHDILKRERERRNISQVDIVGRLMTMGVDVSNATISRIEKGWVPSWPIVTGYCSIFGWTLSELERRLNADEGTVDDTQEELDDNGVKKRFITKAVGRNIPVLSWVNAGSWGESPCIDSYDQESLFVPGKLPKNTFALKVSGSSMENCGGKYHFPNGSYILVNPDAIAKDCDFVVAVDDATQDATFKQLLNDCGKTLFKPLNTQYPVMNVTDTTIIKGVVFRVIDDRKV